MHLFLLFGFSLSLRALFLLCATSILLFPVHESPIPFSASVRTASEVAFAPVSHLWSPGAPASSGTWLAHSIQLAACAVSTSHADDVTHALIEAADLAKLLHLVARVGDRHVLVLQVRGCALRRGRLGSDLVHDRQLEALSCTQDGHDVAQRRHGRVGAPCAVGRRCESHASFMVQKREKYERSKSSSTWQPRYNMLTSARICSNSNFSSTVISRWPSLSPYHMHNQSTHTCSIFGRGELDALRVGWSAARIRSSLSKPSVTAHQVFRDVFASARVFKSHLLLNYPVLRPGVWEQRLQCGQRGCRRLADLVGAHEVTFDT